MTGVPNPKDPAAYRAPCCGGFKNPFHQRPLLSDDGAKPLEAMFKVLANRTRLRLLHALVREPQLCVSEIAERIGMKPQAVSNQLQRLSDRGILESCRSGNQIQYWIVDCCVAPLLAHGLCLAEDTTADPKTESPASKLGDTLHE